MTYKTIVAFIIIFFTGNSLTYSHTVIERKGETKIVKNTNHDYTSYVTLLEGIKVQNGSTLKFSIQDRFLKSIPKKKYIYYVKFPKGTNFRKIKMDKQFENLKEFFIFYSSEMQENAIVINKIFFNQFLAEKYNKLCDIHNYCSIGNNVFNIRDITSCINNSTNDMYIILHVFDIKENQKKKKWKKDLKPISLQTFLKKNKHN